MATKQAATAEAPEPVVVPMIVSPDDYRNQQIAAAKAAAAVTPLDTTVPGGRYLVGGQWVDANGAPIKTTRAVDDDA